MDGASRQPVDDLRDDILSLVRDEQRGAVASILVNLHPADIADLISAMPDEDDQAFIYDLIKDPERASSVLLELPESTRERLLADIPHEELSDLVEELESDDAADLLQGLPDDVAAKVLLDIEPKDLQAVRSLLEFPPDSAGGIMATELLTVPLNAKVGDARDVLRSHQDESEHYFFVYVVDSVGRLEGLLSMRDLVIRRSDRPVAEAMNREPITVAPDMDQEQVAELVRRYDLSAVPVVGGDGTLLGRITVDDVMDVMREEAEEDIARMAGTREEEFDEVSVRRISLLRLPWILTSLFGGLLAGAVLRHFTGTLQALALFLVAFVPVITAMGGNAGSQAATTMVRRLALRRYGWREMGGVVFRESRVGLFLGLICGVIVGSVALLWRGEWYYGVVVGVAMGAAILVAATMGAVVPIVFHRLKVDPAIATGPFVSMSNDVVGLLIYFGLATSLLEFSGRPLIP